MSRSALALLSLALAVAALAQTPPSPEVGNAVLLAGNSIQVDRDTVIVTGDLVVNNASTLAILGEKDLSLDQGVTTPAGFALKANSIDIDAGAIAGGDVRYNVLQNDGTIQGGLFTPLSLPVIATLPQLMDGVAGIENVSVANGQTKSLAAGAYANVAVGRDATLHLGGGTYVFASINAERGASIIFDAAADVVVKGNMTLGASATIDAAPALTTKHKIFFVHGGVSSGKSAVIRATIDAPNGAIVLGDGTQLTGSLLGRDIDAGRQSRLVLRSGFRNIAPVANGQTLATNGTAPLTITLTGFDADGDPLTFSIVTPPAHGTLSAIAPAGPPSATVVYTPAAPDPSDAFVFRVTDSEGATGQATVIINEGTAPPTPPATVTVDDASAQVLQDHATNLPLIGAAPDGVELTFSIVAGSGPSHGTLGSVAQAAPPHPATVVYTPEAGYTGADSFQFQACGTISGNQICDSGTYTIAVVAVPAEPTDLAPDFSVTAPAGEDSSIELPRSSTSGQSVARFVLRPTAAILVGAAVAGNVADANGDGLGDNHNDLPGSAPVLMSAGVGQTGGAGSNGTTRMEFEWDISNFGGTADALQSASVLLHTNRGTVDSANTFFYWVGVDNDGQLTNGDYEHPAEQIGPVVMPVPANQAVGADGTFSFDVLAQVRAAMKAGLSHFSIQGRVNETQSATRGLQVYTTASGNLTNHLEPGLGLATGGLVPPLTYRILSLPAYGSLHDGNGTLIASVPYTLPNAILTYHPPSIAVQTSFNYEVSQALQVDVGSIFINVVLGDCASNPKFCFNGRD